MGRNGGGEHAAADASGATAAEAHLFIMSSFEQRLSRFKQTIGRNLSGEEMRLLRMWDAASQSLPAAAEAPVPAAGGMAEYTGRFKISMSGGLYQVFFVCANVLFRPILVENKDDVQYFLTQPPISLDEFSVQQAIASAEHMRPIQMTQNVTLSEPLLRSMGFQAAG